MPPKQILAFLLCRDRALRCLLYACVPALLFYALSLMTMSAAGFELMEILRDPAQQSGQSSFLGFLSNIGTWVWVSATAILVFALWCGRGRRHGELLLLMAALSSMLAIDDFFMIHDRYVNQKICYLAYALFALALVARHFRTIVSSQGFAFLLAGGLLALSIVTDLIQNRLPMDYAHVQVVEEGFKFIGAVTWLYFSGRMAAMALQPSAESAIKKPRSMAGLEETRLT
ncbi:hypothetical protein SAMN04488540_11244 [Ferrimonas sediminum]|uniref:Oxidase n=1 Tax=Ferrimonas sediminum TaxID=718193 RepID=A0A1G8W091_9GAMM|nr:oxidase [Ferrimonas sediminum]SDJ71473.1 hypothetical protein SAMN04488540_11244 [Ferrimonas sediminum]